MSICETTVQINSSLSQSTPDTHQSVQTCSIAMHCVSPVSIYSFYCVVELTPPLKPTHLSKPALNALGAGLDRCNVLLLYCSSLYFVPLQFLQPLTPIHLFNCSLKHLRHWNSSAIGKLDLCIQQTRRKNIILSNQNHLVFHVLKFSEC